MSADLGALRSELTTAVFVDFENLALGVEQDKKGRFEIELRQFLRASYSALLQTIDQEKALSDDTIAALRGAVEAFKKTVSF